MFNSYIPGKAMLRVLIQIINRNDGKPVKYKQLIDECATIFSRTLYKYRGFPKKIGESAKGRLDMQLIRPYHDMGLIKIDGDKNDQSVAITKEGLEFARLRNPLLDDGEKQQLLSKEESTWLLAYLKRIDKLGYREFSILESLVKFLTGKKRRFGDIVNWFKNDEKFEAWVKADSRHKNDPKAFSRQLGNISTTFATGKIALLRELGIISTSRAKYQVLSSLEV
jgi:hypothetical protein